MAKYLVGPYNNSWNFMDAYNKAQNGDIIEFEDGYAFQWPTNQEIVIDKELHFLGQVVSNPYSYLLTSIRRLPLILLRWQTI